MHLRKKPQIFTNIIVDTLDLINSAPIFHSFWSPSGSVEICEKTALHALYMNKTPLAEISHNLTKNTGLLNPPINSFDDHSINGNVWHEGALFHIYLIGEIRSTFACCDLTENERERYLGQYRTMIAKGYSVYALASGTQTAQPKNHRDIQKGKYLNFDGFMIVSYPLRPYIHRCVELAKQQGRQLIYISSDDPIIVTSIARRAEIIEQNQESTDCFKGIDLKLNTAYANVDAPTRQVLLERYVPYVVVNGNDLRDYLA